VELVQQGRYHLLYIGKYFFGRVGEHGGRVRHPNAEGKPNWFLSLAGKPWSRGIENGFELGMQIQCLVSYHFTLEWRQVMSLARFISVAAAQDSHLLKSFARVWGGGSVDHRGMLNGLAAVILKGPGLRSVMMSPYFVSVLPNLPKSNA
jgi:hypothetical protein